MESSFHIRLFSEKIKIMKLTFSFLILKIFLIFFYWKLLIWPLGIISFIIKILFQNKPRHFIVLNRSRPLTYFEEYIYTPMVFAFDEA